MKNIRELRQNLSEVFSGLKSGKVNPVIAAEMNNTAGKMIGTVKVELEYAALRKEKPAIPFLDGTSTT